MKKENNNWKMREKFCTTILFLLLAVYCFAFSTNIILMYEENDDCTEDKKFVIIINLSFHVTKLRNIIWRYLKSSQTK